MSAELEFNNKRLSKIEETLEKLAEISSNLSKVLAVQDEKQNNQEKNLNNINVSLEKRRTELEDKLIEVYKTMKEEDKNILIKLDAMIKKQTEQHDLIEKKINDMQKIIWTYLGAISVIFFLLDASKIVALFG